MIEQDNLTHCDKCGKVLEHGEYPFCPHGFGQNAQNHDEIPGGVLIENLGPTPIRVYSHSERLRIAAANGRMEAIRHVPVPGTDKSPYTTDWSKGSIDPKTLDNARVLVMRQAESPSAGTEDADNMDSVVQNRFAVTGTTADARHIIDILKGN